MHCFEDAGMLTEHRLWVLSLLLLLLLLLLGPWALCARRVSASWHKLQHQCLPEADFNHAIKDFAFTATQLLVLNEDMLKSRHFPIKFSTEFLYPLGKWSFSQLHRSCPQDREELWLSPLPRSSQLWPLIYLQGFGQLWQPSFRKPVGGEKKKDVWKNGGDVGGEHGLNLTQDVLRQLVKICGRGWALLSCHHFFRQQAPRIKLTHKKSVS